MGGDGEFPVLKQDSYLHVRCLGWNLGSKFHRLDIKLNSKRKTQYSQFVLEQLLNKLTFFVPGRACFSDPSHCGDQIPSLKKRARSFLER